MTKILFICWGNICRSPAAEFIMKDLVHKAGLDNQILVASAAVSTEEIWNGAGNPIYAPMRKELLAAGIGTPENELGVSQKRAQVLVPGMYAQYDYLIGMDRDNLKRMKRICGGDPKGKMSLLLDHTDRPGEVADPWYTRNFSHVLEQVKAGCRGLLEKIQQNGRNHLTFSI